MHSGGGRFKSQRLVGGMKGQLKLVSSMEGDSILVGDDHVNVVVT